KRKSDARVPRSILDRWRHRYRVRAVLAAGGTEMGARLESRTALSAGRHLGGRPDLQDAGREGRSHLDRHAAGSRGAPRRVPPRGTGALRRARVDCRAAAPDVTEVVVEYTFMALSPEGA